MKNLNVCFVGCGEHANRFIYPALKSVEGVTLQAIAVLPKDNPALCAKHCGAQRAYDDFRNMITAEKPDAGLIVGPPQLHYDAGMYCLEKGIPFFIEKPMGKNLEQASSMTKKARETQGFGQVGFMMRHSAVKKKIDTVMESRNTGEILYGTVRYLTSGPYRSDEIYGMPGTDDLSYLWRYLMIQAVHPVNLAASFLGKIVKIDPEVIWNGENIVVEIRLKDENGRLFRILLHTLVSPGYGNLQFGLDLYFADRSMIFTDAFHSLNYFPPEKSSNGNCEHWQFATFGDNSIKMGYGGEIAYFIDSVRKNGQTPNLTTLEDGLKTMEILDTVYNIIKKRT
ncbi:MAG: Gfo/Idh/MocA family oxidoreductase [Victivallales bacterium]|jgi:predicted dehydrogenase|nr:Gfo/Idh/MocA family oxidoreductase [Victivallales bacterium]